MELLVPSWGDLAGWAGVLFASAALLGFGRLLSSGRAAPEVSIVVGWGGACLILTLWGVLTPASLRVPAWLIAGFGLGGLVMPRLRPDGAAWQALLRVGVLVLPLVALMASVRPSLPDTFLNLLPNAAYLFDHASFPGDDRPPSYSFLPGAPYNLQLYAFLASLVTPGFPASAMIAINLVLQIAFGLFIARLLSRSEEDPSRAPSWGACALGLLLATVFNPGFAPRYHFSSYSEPSVTVALALAAWLAVRVLDRMAARRPVGAELWLWALTLAALVEIKQDSVALTAGVIASAGVLAWLGSRGARTVAAARIALAAAPAVVLYLAWRWYVVSHFAVGELKLLPADEWQLHNLPLILRSMTLVMAQKGFLFASLAVVFAVLAWRLARRGWDSATRLAAMLLGVFLCYNLALMFTYVAHFPGQMGTDAHSYFRYITHLGLLLVVAALSLARDIGVERHWTLRRWGAPLSAASVALVLASPLLFLGFLRFDLEEPALRARYLAHAVAGHIGEKDRLALVLPGDNGSLAAAMESLLRDEPPRRPMIDLRVVSRLDADTLARLSVDGYGMALISCSSGEIAGVAPGRAALLALGDAGWQVVETWSYPPPAAGAHWSHVLSEAPLCL